MLQKIKQELPGVGKTLRGIQAGMLKVVAQYRQVMDFQPARIFRFPFQQLIEIVLAVPAFGLDGIAFGAFRGHFAPFEL